MIKKHPDLHGACIDNFHKLYNADLYLLKNLYLGIVLYNKNI